MPKYFPQNHTLTKWLIIQMRSRNGLHRLVSFANLQPKILSEYFEIIDDPANYTELKIDSQLSAYSRSTILFLTPLAIAVYLGYQSVIQMFLDFSGTKLNSESCRNVNVKAKCYGKNKDYFTTSPIIIAIRRERYECLRLLIANTLTSSPELTFVEHLGTHLQSENKSVDILDYSLKLLLSKPGLNLVQIYQILHSQSTLSSTCSSSELMSYDLYYRESNQPDVWCSLFQRLCEKGLSHMYSNCGSKILPLLEMIAKSGFFRQDFMPRNTVSYNVSLYCLEADKRASSIKIRPSDIRNLEYEESQEANLKIAIDRDTCFALLTVWLEQMKRKGMERISHRLTELLLSILVDTNMLSDFILSKSIDGEQSTSLSPVWLHLVANFDRPSTKICFDSDTSVLIEDFYYLDPVQLRILKSEFWVLALRRGYIDQDSNDVCQKHNDIFEIGKEVSHCFDNSRANVSGDYFSESEGEFSKISDINL